MALPLFSLLLMTSKSIFFHCFVRKLNDFGTYFICEQQRFKVCKEAKIGNRYNQVPHLTHDTVRKCHKNTIKHHTQEKLCIHKYTILPSIYCLHTLMVDVLEFRRLVACKKSIMFVSLVYGVVLVFLCIT